MNLHPLRLLILCLRHVNFAIQFQVLRAEKLPPIDTSNTLGEDGHVERMSVNCNPVVIEKSSTPVAPLSERLRLTTWFTYATSRALSVSAAHYILYLYCGLVFTIFGGWSSATEWMNLPKLVLSAGIGIRRSRPNSVFTGIQYRLIDNYS